MEKLNDMPKAVTSLFRIKCVRCKNGFTLSVEAVRLLGFGLHCDDCGAGIGFEILTGDMDT
jgi:hypothetical protein